MLLTYSREACWARSAFAFSVLHPSTCTYTVRLSFTLSLSLSHSLSVCLIRRVVYIYIYILLWAHSTKTQALEKDTVIAFIIFKRYYKHCAAFYSVFFSSFDFLFVSLRLSVSLAIIAEHTVDGFFVLRAKLLLILSALKFFYLTVLRLMLWLTALTRNSMSHVSTIHWTIDTFVTYIFLLSFFSLFIYFFADLRWRSLEMLCCVVCWFSFCCMWFFS